MVGKYDCTTWPGGSKAVRKADWSSLKGKDIVIWPDADEPGYKAALDIADALKPLKPKSVAIVPPPPNKDGEWDLADALKEGWSMDKATMWIGSNRLTPEGFLRHAAGKYGINQPTPRNRPTASPRSSCAKMACTP